ncbi:MAG: hypothetical protein H8E84_04520 [Flavobacteriales bacterium]|nr:hypothetical protein [Flavobacteriales bacterium]
MKSKSVKIILSIVLTLLLIPLIAMQFTDEVSWTILDFTAMGILLLSTALLCELTIRKVSKIKYKIIFFVVILLGFLLVWAELAVGITETLFTGN